MNSTAFKRTTNYQTLKDNLLLDVFYIGYQDLGYGQPTSKSDLYRTMFNTYLSRGYSKNQIQNVIGVITKSNWYRDRGKDIHLTERGVEVYFRLRQIYDAEKTADEATKWAKRATVYSTLIGILLLIATIGDIVFKIFEKH